MQTLFLWAVIVMFFAVPIANVILFITYFATKRKFEIKGLTVSLVLFAIEVALFTIMFVSPVKDGGVFFQGFIAEVAGVCVIISQVIAIVKVKKELKCEERKN